jgi:uncharacterized protein (DUF4415 family)
MTGNSDVSGSDFAKIDAHEITPAEYEDIPELTDEDFARGTIRVNGIPVSKPRGRPPVSGGKEQIAFRVDKDVLQKFRADGPGWQGRMNEVLRKAAGLG